MPGRHQPGMRGQHSGRGNSRRPGRDDRGRRDAWRRSCPRSITRT